jgi:starvation-inducible DNA-binding protein
MESQMFKTKNDLPENVRTKIIELLNHRLADCLDLQLNTKQAHWNVKGPNFIALHKLFDETYENITEFTDEIAERIIQLGGVAEGDSRTVAKRSTLKEYPLSLSSGRDHVDYLSNSLATFGKSVRAAIDLSTELRDADTADLFTGISRGVDKYLWFVEAHLQADK